MGRREERRARVRNLRGRGRVSGSHEVVCDMRSKGPREGMRENKKKRDILRVGGLPIEDHATMILPV